MVLKELFEIEDKEERQWVIWFSVAIFFLFMATVMLTKMLQAFVIERIGVEFLPFIHIIGAFVITFGAWLTLDVMRKWKAQFQSAIFGGVAVLGAFVLAASQGIFTEERGAAFNLIFVMIGVLVGTMAATTAYEKIRIAATDVFDYEQFNRFEPIFASVVTVAILVGGLLLAGLSGRIGLGGMYLLVALILAGSIPAYVMLGRMGGSMKAQALPSETAKHGFLAALSLKNHIPNPRLLRFLKLLAVIVGLTAIFAQIFEYAFDVMASSRFSTEEELNAFFGGYVFLLSLTGLVFINFVQEKLFSRYGLTNNLYTPPVVVLVASVFMFAYPFFWVVIGVVFTREIILGVQDSAYSSMMEGVGDYQRKQAWAWIKGPANSAFALTGALILLGVGYLFVPQGPAVTVRVLAVLATIFLLVRFILTMRFKRAYPGILLDAMGKGDFKTRLRAIEAMAEMRYMKDRHLGQVLNLIEDEEEPTAVRITALKALGAIKDPSVLRVVSRFTGHPDPAIRAASIRAISAFDYEPDKLYESGFSRHTLIADLRELLPEESDDDVRSAALDALIALQDPDIIEYLITELKSGDSGVRHSVLRAMRRFKDPAVIDYVQTYLEDDDPSVRSQAIIAVWQFPWERQTRLRKAVDAMLKSPKDSKEYLTGLYLSGALKLKKNRKKLLEGLKAEDEMMRITCAVALFKLGDNAGIGVAREAMESGDEKKAHKFVRLRHHYNVPEKQQQVIEALIHRYHLHYPQDLPVSEPLRKRLVEIPKLCLEGLLAYYSDPTSAGDRQKIERTLQHERFPDHKGRVVLAGLSDPWREMAAIALLANGYLVREAGMEEEFDETAVVVADTESDRFPAKTVYLAEKAEGMPIGQVAKTHYAPSELVTEVEKLSE